MVRTVGIGLPIGGLAVGVTALALWFSSVSLEWLDILVTVLFGAGLALSVAGYFRGRNDRTRRIGVIGIGWNAFGLAAVAILYAAG
jgi:hypothetical protein